MIDAIKRQFGKDRPGIGTRLADTFFGPDAPADMRGSNTIIVTAMTWMLLASSQPLPTTIPMVLNGPVGLAMALMVLVSVATGWIARRRSHAKGEGLERSPAREAIVSGAASAAYSAILVAIWAAAKAYGLDEWTAIITAMFGSLLIPVVAVTIMGLAIIAKRSVAR